MLLAEYDYATNIAVQREEAGKIAFCSRHGTRWRARVAQGLATGSLQATLETARLMLQHNYPIAEVCLMATF